MPTKRTYTAAEKKAYASRMAKSRTRSTRPTSTVSGRGFYKGFGRDVGRFVGGVAGRGVGLSGPLAELGGYIGNRASKITGFGSYSIPDALTQNTLVLPSNPRIVNDLQREGAVVISHREHIGTVKSSIGFTRQYELPINPGQNATFPWLSAVASNFTQYEMLGVIFEYVSTSGNAISSTNNALGEVIMTVNANSLDPSYVNKTQMLNSDFTQAFAPSSNGALPVECSPQLSTLTKLYVRFGSNPSGGDLRMSDLGVFTMATSGMQQADVEIGELYVNYQLALIKPQLVSELGYTTPTAYYQLVGSTNAAPIGTGPVANFDSIGITFSGNVVTIPRNVSSRLLVRFHWFGASTAIVTPGVVSQVNNTNVLLFNNVSTNIIYNTPSTSTDLFLEFALELTDPSIEGSFTLNGAGTLPTSLVASEMMITQVNYETPTKATF